MAYMNTVTKTTNTIMDRFAGLVEKIEMRMKERRIYKETFNGLNDLRTAELADLGLTRSELHSIAVKAARDAVAR